MAMGEKLLYDTGIHLLPEKNTNDNQLLRQKNAVYDHYHELVDLCAVSFHLRTLELYQCTWSMLPFCGGVRVAHSL
jgi:hypothetical protein